MKRLSSLAGVEGITRFGCVSLLIRSPTGTIRRFEANVAKALAGLNNRIVIRGLNLRLQGDAISVNGPALLQSGGRPRRVHEVSAKASGCAPGISPWMNLQPSSGLTPG